MKFFKEYIITAIVGLLLAVVLIVSAKDEGNTLTNAKQRSYDDNWTVQIGKQEKFYKELPDTLPRKNNETKFILKKQLPQEIAHGDTVAFYMGHNVIHAYVDNEMVYSFNIPKDYEKTSKTPGTTWTFINLSSEYAGKTLTIELEPVYEDKAETLPDIIYGDSAKIVVDIITDRSLALFASILMFAIGLAIIIGLMYFQREFHVPDYLYWLGVFSIVVAFWSGIQTQIISLIYAQNVRGNQVAFIVFQMLLIPLVSFVKNFCEVEESKIYDGICVANVVILVVTTVLQFLGIRDYRETIWMAYVVYGIGFLWMLWIVGKRIVQGKKKERRRMIIQGLCLGELLFFVGYDMVRYLQCETVDSARLSRYALLAYIVIMLCIVFQNSIHLMRLGEQFENISKEARIDALTKLSNRTAFEHDLMSYEATQKSAAVMFDLNNLKYFNDTHGHATGDYYIIVCSEIIQDIFGMYGKVYRIGGDEFCAVTEGVTEEEFMELRRGMNDRIEALNGRFFENKMSVASGYAAYDKKSDHDIHDTIKRADQKMYECKAAMKGR